MLCSLLAKYGSTSNFEGTDKSSGHTYGPLYEEKFARLKHTATRVLEIGVMSGASLMVWAEYFENAIVDGADIDFSHIVFDKVRDHPRIRLHQVDCAAANAPQHLGGATYDLIIDDASHDPRHQLWTAHMFLPYVKSGGLYVVEDIHEVHADVVRQGLDELAQSNNATLEWHDRRELNGLDDEIVVIIRK